MIPLPVRQLFVAFRLRWFGRAAPRDVMSAFGVSRATASSDVAAIRRSLASARFDEVTRSLVAAEKDSGRLCEALSEDPGAALDILFAQDQLRRLGAGSSPWSSARLEDRIPARTKPSAKTLRTILVALEESTPIRLSGDPITNLPTIFYPQKLVRTITGYRIRGIDATRGLKREIDLSGLLEADNRPATVREDRHDAPSILIVDILAEPTTDIITVDIDTTDRDSVSGEYPPLDTTVVNIDSCDKLFTSRIPD